MAESEDGAQFEAFGDLAEDIVLPMVGARFIAGIDAEGKRSSAFHIHFDDETVTPIEVVGLVQVSLWEWLHQVLHDRDD